MAEEEGSGQGSASTVIANELIEFANNKQEAGVDAAVIAAALRHAAANFTAFAVHATEAPLNTEDIVEEFVGWLHYYDGRLRSVARPMTPLEKLVKQVKNE
jgi:F420-0:gamma-glutamyl ligase-like protein